MAYISPIRVAFQGEPGAFSEMAAREYFENSPIETIACRRFQDACELVEANQCEYAFLPIENSTYGTVARTYELLLETQLYIIGELYFHVNQCLIAPHGTALEDVHTVRSHYQALGQCRQWLTQRNIETVEWYDTAGAVKSLQEQPAPGIAAIASQLAAELYGMQVLASKINDAGRNYTRFILLARSPAPIKRGTSKTSIVFSFKENHPGNLFRALGVFSLRDIDLSKLESRPMPDTPFNYMFYVDFIGDQNEHKCARALEHLREMTDVRVLGSYPRQAEWE